MEEMEFLCWREGEEVSVQDGGRVTEEMEFLCGREGTR